MKIGICDSGLSYRPSNVVEVRNFTNRNKFDVDDNLKTKHGTHITNIISSLCPQVDIYVAKTMDIRKGAIDYLYPAIRWLVLQCEVNVINCSFGSLYEDVELRNLIRLCEILGVTIVCASGNNPNQIIYPSAYDFGNIIRVGAMDKDLVIPDWSSRDVDIFALGVDVNAQVGENEWKKMSGTSQASAIVTGTLVNLDGDKDKLFEMCVDGKLIFE